MIKHRPWLTALLILIAPASIAETSFPEKSVFKERVPNVLQETPYYQPAVDNGTLEPIEQRIPLSPYIDNGSHNPQAQSGGQINILMSKSKDVRRMVTYGYARLVGFTEKLTLAADILESYEVAEGRIFTFTLRAGHRWSDGHPFTTDDFRYYWEDVANNKDISSFGPPKALLVNGQKPTVEYINATTIRYSWAQPNPNFLLALAGARPLFLYRPAHYLKQFHSRYADPKQLAEKVGNAKLKYKSWAGLHQRRDHLYKFDNIELPTLQPWLPTTQKPSERFIFVRNPYYHRLDTQGRQLPYIDKFIINIASGKLISAKASAGESDLQGR
jgi:peptide/nickel transport system substrate-binding protein